MGALPIIKDLSHAVDKAVENLWKPWQTYHQSNPSSLSDFGDQVADVPLYNKYTKRLHENASTPPIFFIDDQYTMIQKEDDHDVAARNLGMIIGHTEGFKKFRPNVEKLDPNQLTSQPMRSSSTNEDENLPNLLIYFPPPMNFFIYYSIGNHSHITTKNISSKTDKNGDSKPKLKVGTRMSSYLPKDYDEDSIFYQQIRHFSQDEEFEFVRKIIRELVNYWDDEERTFENSKKSNNGAVGVQMGNFHERLADINRTLIDQISFDKDDGKTHFNTFFEWLLKNVHMNSTQLLEKKIQVNEEQENENFNLSNLGDSKKISPEEIRVLINIDRNLDIMKKLFTINKTVDENYSNYPVYQVVADLKKNTDRQKEDLLSRKLNQLHQNMASNEKMPKILWVFPVYGSEGNETIINEMKKRSREKVNTLKDADSPMENVDDRGHTQHAHDQFLKNTENHKGYKENEDMNSDSNADDPMDDTEIQDDYDDQDMYDDIDYEQTDSDQLMKNSSIGN